MRKFEYKVAEVAGQADGQQSALNELGAEGWVLTHIEHYGITQARAYLMRAAPEANEDSSDPSGKDGTDEPKHLEAPKSEAAALTVQNAETVTVETTEQPVEGDGPAAVETSGSADGDTKPAPGAA